MSYTYIKSDLDFIKQYDEDVGEYNYMALGADGKRRAVNSCMGGFAPLKTDDLCVPLLVLKNQIKYGDDNYAYNGMYDV